MDEFLFEECELDLLDIVSVNEAHILINKNKLDDEEYVKQLIKDLDNNKDNMYNEVMIINGVVLVTSAILQLMAPSTIAKVLLLCSLVDAIVYYFQKDYVKDRLKAKEAQKISTQIYLAIIKLEKQPRSRERDASIRKLRRSKEIVDKCY